MTVLADCLQVDDAKWARLFLLYGGNPRHVFEYGTERRMRVALNSCRLEEV